MNSFSLSTAHMSHTAKVLFWAAFLAVFILLLWMFKSILTPFILGITIAYLLDPIMRRFARKQIPRWVTSLVILSLFCATLALLFVLVAPMAFRQGQQLIEQFPNYVQNMMDYFSPYMSYIEDRFGDDYMDKLNTYLQESAGKIVGAGGTIAMGLATGGKFVVEAATTMVVTPIVAFFMMKEWPNITRWVESLYPRQHAVLIHTLLHKINIKVAGFIRGQIIVAFILGVVYAIALTIAGLSYGFLIGIFAGLFSIIPLVGSTLGLLVSLIVAWFQTGDLLYTGVIAAIFLGGQFMEGNFLAPKVVGESVGLHPLWIMFALLAGGSLFGILGMLIAVPVAAIVGVLAGFAIDQYKQSPLYLREPDLPPVVQPVPVIILDPTLLPAEDIRNV